MYTKNMSYPSEVFDVARGRDRPIERTSRDLLNRFEAYARERPTTVALWAFGLGFVLGWRLKPW